MLIFMEIKRFAEMMKGCNNVFDGGTEEYTESGIKDYRSQDGLYNTHKALANIPIWDVRWCI